MSSNNNSESPRDPRIHRQTGIPSVSRPRISSAQGSVDSGQSEDANIGKRGPFKTLKNTAYHFLSKSSDVRVSRIPTVHPDTEDDKMDNTTTRSAGTQLTGNNVILPIADSVHLDNKVGSSKMVSKSMFRGPSILEMGKAISVSDAPLPACARKPDPRLIMSSLKSVLGTEHDVGKYLDINHLLALHQLDQVDFEDRDRLRAQLTKQGKPNISDGKNATTVLGEPIRRSSIYSSTSVVLAGREHELPIIVVNTVEELYRTGIYQPNLFRTLPNRARLLDLIQIYDSEERQSQADKGPTDDPLASRFGLNASLHLETTPDVCALLATYISSLPEPILPPMFFRPIWDWCGLDDNQLEPSMRGQDSFGPRMSHIPLARTYTSPTESARILVAQLLLQLLPSPNFSLLIYLLAFFSQASLVNEENGVDVPDLSKMFGVSLFGEDPEVDNASASRTRRDGEAMMNWFLRRWGPLSEGIFEVVEDAQMGLFHRPLARRDSFGKDILANWLPGLGSNSSQSSPDGHSVLAGPGSHTPDVTGSPTHPLSCDPLKTITTHSTPKLPGKESSIVSSLSRTLGDEDFEVIPPPSSDAGINETLDLRPAMNHNDGLSTAALDERLLDMSMPILLDETMSGVCSIPNTTTYTSRETQTTSPLHFGGTTRLTAHLEAQLIECTRTLTQALADLSKSTLDACRLQRRVCELEAELAAKCSTVHGIPYVAPDQTSKLETQDMTSEREDARHLVNEIKKLIRS